MITGDNSVTVRQFLWYYPQHPSLRVQQLWALHADGLPAKLPKASRQLSTKKNALGLIDLHLAKLAADVIRNLPLSINSALATMGLLLGILRLQQLTYSAQYGCNYDTQTHAWWTWSHILLSIIVSSGADAPYFTQETIYLAGSVRRFASFLVSRVCIFMITVFKVRMDWWIYSRPRSGWILLSSNVQVLPMFPVKE